MCASFWVVRFGGMCWLVLVFMVVLFVYLVLVVLLWGGWCGGLVVFGLCCSDLLCCICCVVVVGLTVCVLVSLHLFACLWYSFGLVGWFTGLFALLVYIVCYRLGLLCLLLGFDCCVFLVGGFDVSLSWFVLLWVFS